MYKQYLLKLMLFLALFSLPICGNWLFLLNSGELLPIEEIVDKQLSSDQYCIVGLATRNQGYYYKRAMYQRIKPEVFVHGSSRVMQIRSDYFSEKMFNSGGTMSSVNEGYSFLKDVFKGHKPKIMIIGIDYWWFNKSVIEPTTAIKPPLELSPHISFRSYLLPYVWLWQKKISFSDYIQKVDPVAYFKTSYDEAIGVDGKLNRTGYGPDGSYFNTKIAIGKERSLDEQFHTNIAMLTANDPHYEKGSSVNDIHFQNFLDMVNFIKENKVKVIFFIPPLAPTMVDKLEHFTLIEDLRDKLREAQIPFYDFHDPRSLHAGDCEFIDGTHGGELLYVRILDHIAEQEPQLKQYLNTSYVNRVKNHLKNIAIVPKREMAEQPEVDFLHLGCDKSSQYAFLKSRNSSG